MTEPRNMFPEGTTMRKVIDYATKEFFAKGVKQVTMDSIAKGLQMSKRTLYQLFADKEQLIIACIEVMSEQEHRLALSLAEKDYNVLEIILRIIENRMRALENVSPHYLHDIGKYPSVQEYINMSKEESISRIKKIFQTGLQQGFFRSDINIDLLMYYICGKEHNTSSQSELSNYTIPEIFKNIGIFHLRGCCTPKGIELIDKYLEHYNTEQREKSK